MPVRYVISATCLRFYGCQPGTLSSSKEISFSASRLHSGAFPPFYRYTTTLGIRIKRVPLGNSYYSELDGAYQGRKLYAHDSGMPAEQYAETLVPQVMPGGRLEMVPTQ